MNTEGNFLGRIRLMNDAQITAEISDHLVAALTMIEQLTYQDRQTRHLHRHMTVWWQAHLHLHATLEDKT